MASPGHVYLFEKDSFDFLLSEDNTCKLGRMYDYFVIYNRDTGSLSLRQKLLKNKLMTCAIRAEWEGKRIVIKNGKSYLNVIPMKDDNEIFRDVYLRTLYRVTKLNVVYRKSNNIDIPSVNDIRSTRLGDYLVLYGRNQGIRMYYKLSENDVFPAVANEYGVWYDNRIYLLKLYPDRKVLALNVEPSTDPVAGKFEILMDSVLPEERNRLL